MTHEYAVPVENFAIGNVPEGFKASIKELENENIKNYKISLSGIEQDMKKIDEKDIIGVIDMQVLAEKQGIEEWTAGSYVSEITFNLPEDIIIEEPYSFTIILEDINAETENE